MQILNSSEEGIEKGLSLIDERFKKFDNSLNLRILYGLNYVKIIRENKLINGNKKKFYFVILTMLKLTKNVIATTDYGISFPSIINFENLYLFNFIQKKSK